MLKIKNLNLKSNIIAAPMAGFTDAPWRVLAVNHGAALVFSEMISVGSIIYGNEKWEPLAENDDRARPYALQLFGANPDWFIKALELISKIPFDMIDINMGCPMKKVTQTGAGSALMKTPELAREIISSVRKRYKGPLSVKFRSGWDFQSINAVEFAKMAESAGADALILHPRTRAEMFTGKSNWDLVREVKESVKVPVIGSGDIYGPADAEKMFKLTGCDAVMIGRASIGRPWIFAECAAKRQFSPDEIDVFKIVREHIGLERSMKDDYGALTMMKKFIPKYLKGKRGVKELSRNINLTTKFSDALDCLEGFERLHNIGD